jgi:pimeloyl-CoA synthetase
MRHYQFSFFEAESSLVLVAFLCDQCSHVGMTGYVFTKKLGLVRAIALPPATVIIAIAEAECIVMVHKMRDDLLKLFVCD